MRYFIISLLFTLSIFSLGNIFSNNLFINTAFCEEKTDEAKVETKSNEKSNEQTTVLSVPSKPFTLINQNNEPVVLDSLIGKPLVMSFIFTRCPLPEMCPLIMQKIVKVQTELNKEFKDKVFFAIMTFDPEYDTPEVLKQYGKNYGVDFDNLIYLTGDKDHVTKAINHFRVYFEQEASGLIAHTLETMIMDEKGIIKKIFPTTIWHPKSVIKEVKNIIKNWEEQGTAKSETETN